jgi:hypothetical protein
LANASLRLLEKDRGEDSKGAAAIECERGMKMWLKKDERQSIGLLYGRLPADSFWPMQTFLSRSCARPRFARL